MLQKVAPYFTRARALLFALSVNNKSYYSAKHNYKLDQIRICNKQWHHPPFFRLDGDAPSKYGGVGRLLCVPDFP